MQALELYRKREKARNDRHFDTKGKVYPLVVNEKSALGCGNYSPTHFGLSLPEVTEVRNNEDGTIVLTIHAVCDSVVCNDVVITHELTMKIQDDGTIQYVGNRILDNGIDNIPRYQYRLGNLQN